MFMVSIKLVLIFGQPSLGYEKKIPAVLGMAAFSPLNYSGKQL